MNKRLTGNQSGKGWFGVIFSLAILGAASYSAWVLIPIKINTYEFLDRMREEARFGAVNKKDSIVHDRLMQKAKQLELPLKPENLHVEREGGTYVITARYSIPVDLKVYQTMWDFDQKATAPIF